VEDIFSIDEEDMDFAACVAITAFLPAYRNKYFVLFLHVKR
jgi:hypothetical protein